MKLKNLVISNFSRFIIIISENQLKKLTERLVLEEEFKINSSLKKSSHGKK